MSGSLPLKYRPNEFEYVYGNDDAIGTVKAILSREALAEIPKAWLFTGESGTGKTTMVRIMQEKLGCKDVNFHEYNSANARKIDNIREISAFSRLSAMGGGIKIFLLDECFSKGTMVLTPRGEVPIEKVKKNDTVFSLFGIDTVTATMKKKVALDRIIALHKSDGTTTICSEEHPFYINGKWVQAKNLTNISILSYDSESVLFTNSQIGDKNEYKNMRTMSERIQTEKNSTEMVFKGLCECFTNKTNTIWNMQKLWQFCKETKQVLFPQMCSNMEELSTRNKKENVHKRKEREHKKRTQTILKNRKSKNYFQRIFGKNEKEQSINYERSNRKTDFIKKVKQSSFFYKTWWERYWSYNSRKTIANSIRQFLELQLCCITWKETEGVPNMLQNRCCQPMSEIRNRGRWWIPQYDHKKETGRKETEKVRTIRVEDITFYKSGNNREHFKSVIGSKERNQGFVEFFDLSIKNHHSYVADGNMVHNCHQITKDAQNALLKVLEDTPANTYFFLATTNPEKLVKAIKTRCTTISMKPCNWKVLSDLCKDIAQEEGVELSTKVAIAIGKAAGGSPREALKILDQVIDIEEEEQILSSIEKTIWSEPEMFELCQTLLNKPIWKEVRTVLKPILEVADTEGIRRMVLGYFNSVLLGKDSIRAALILEQFIKIGKYDVSKAEITYACYSAVFEIQQLQDTGEDVPF